MTHQKVSVAYEISRDVAELLTAAHVPLWFGHVRYADGVERFCVGASKAAASQWCERAMWAPYRDALGNVHITVR